MMSQSCFAGNLEDALAELEGLTVELQRSDPDELTIMGGLLARRLQATASVTSQLAQQTGWPEAHLARLTAAWQGGQQVEERLKLVVAGTRHHLQELYRAACHTRAIAADLGQAGHNFDIEA